MPEVTMATIVGWALVALLAYILGEYTSVFLKMWYGMRRAGSGVRQIKGRPARLAFLATGGFLGGVYAGGFLLAAAASFVGGLGLAAGGSLLFGLTAKETLVVFMIALLAGLAIYSGAAADEAAEEAGD